VTGDLVALPTTVVGVCAGQKPQQRDRAAAGLRHYIPDVATGLMTLGLADEHDFGRPWMLPCSPAGTLRDLVARLSAAAAGSHDVGSL
jgi:hypothetical protein